MRRFTMLIFALCGFAAPAFAQFTTVTATVTDPSGIPYAGAVMNAILVPGASGGYTLGGQPYSGRVGPVTLDSGGKFTAQFGDVTMITPGSPQWQITIDSAASTVQLPLGTGPQSFVFTSTGTTISGSSPVSLTSALNALAPKLTNFAVGGTVTTTGTPVANQVAEFSSATAITGNARFTDNGTTLSYTGSGGLSVTGGPSTFNNSAGSGALDIIFGIIDRIHGSCGNGSGYRFATIEAGNADILTNATQGGYNLVCPDNTTDTATGQNEIGSTTKTVADNLYPGNQWLDNTSTAHTYSWGIHSASALFGENIGAIGGSRTGGAYLKYGCSANTTYGVDTADGHSGGGTAYARFQNILLEGCQTGTVGTGSPSIAMLNWEGISETNILESILVFGFANTIGCRYASNNNSGNAVVGPLNPTNVWCDGGYNTGSRPVVISANGAGVLPIFDIGGVANHPGSGLAAYEVNGNGAGGSIFGGHIMKYWENQQNGSSIMQKFVDANNYTIEGAMTLQTTDTGVDYSQTGAGRTCNMFVQGLRLSNTTASAIVNHISGFSESGKNYVPLYHYGGDSSCSFYPYTIDSNKVQILNQTGVAHLIKNNADSELDSDIDSGTTAVQNAYLRLLDRGTVEWLVGKASNIFRVTDAVNTHVHFAGVQNGETDINAWGSAGIQFNVTNNSVGPPARWYSGGATSIEVGRMDATGNIFLTCHTTTFQNCTEITAPNGAGGASAVVITAPTVSGTMMVTGQNSAQKTQRFGASCTTAASAAATCTSTFSWTTAFADANYTPVCWGEGPAGSPIISLNATQVAASVTVQVQAATAVASSFAGVYCHATHD